jgi:hypothetical protein
MWGNGSKQREISNILNRNANANSFKQGIKDNILTIININKKKVVYRGAS